jgi:hypothetical protein
VALTKLDVLDEVEEIRIATSYRIGTAVTDEFPDDVADLLDAEPVYETMPGWQASTSGVTAYEKLPEAARRYVARLEELLGAPAGLISTGPSRSPCGFRSSPPSARPASGRIGADRAAAASGGGTLVKAGWLPPGQPESEVTGEHRVGVLPVAPR